MRYSEQIKSISYIKANAAEVLDELDESREPIIITQNGEARAVLMDVRSYEQSQETLALLQILAIGKKQVQRGETMPLDEAVGKLRKSIATKQAKPRSAPRNHSR